MENLQCSSPVVHSNILKYVYINPTNGEDKSWTLTHYVESIQSVESMEPGVFTAMYNPFG